MFLLLQYDLHDTFKDLLPIQYSWTRQLWQHTHIWSCVSQYRSRFLHHCLLVFCKALPLTPEFLTSYERFSWYSWSPHPQVQWGRNHVIFWHWFLDSTLSLRFAFWCIRHMLPHIWPHIVGVLIVSLLSVDHENPWHFISYNYKSCETCPCFWQFSIFIYVPIIFQHVFPTIHPVTYVLFW